ncbi:hypothetical protein DJ010_21410 [Nocardioides silvaticus]|uniref:GH16 domain-containing protein n=1 Tax=Nocardioides silvaticus TaxID=2201891 RepID=A0A316TMC1_9ACTN|nr:hypothetical protein DJ010_21410 [Nocardioides silvaticus]
MTATVSVDDAAAADGSVTTISELRAASGSCTGTRTAPTTITLAADIVAPDAQVDVGCHAILSLAGHDLTVRNVVIAGGRALTVTDTGTGGTLTADAGATSDVAGIQNTLATLTVASGTVVATGGQRAAGIGGGPSGNGGATKITGGTVIASSVNTAETGSSAIGPGDGGSSFGTLAVTGGLLRLPSGILRVPNSTGVEIAVGAAGVIDGSGGSGATYATVVGAGQIDNRGRILLPSEKVTAAGVTVTGLHYAVSFNTQGGSAAPAPVTVFASTFARGARTFPASPTKSGASFTAWNSAADGSGVRVAATDVLRGASVDGAPVPITAYAQWRVATVVPAITAITPTSGPPSGGTSVVITGTGFTGATKVLFGTAPAASFTVDSATRITAVSPPSATVGVRAITVTTPGGVSPAVTAGRFTYAAPAPVPVLTSIAPASGPVAGGTSVVVKGTGFTGATKVLFGTAPATRFTVNSATQITAVSPPSATPGAQAITVTTAGGVSAAVTAAAFTYAAPAPAVTSIAPSSGPIAGGTDVVIKGTGFTGATKVLFGTAPAASFTVDSATQITAVSPTSATTGLRAVTVTTASGTSAAVTAAAFTYTAPVPVLTSIAPSSGPIAGGTAVVITGTGFSGATRVKFGNAGLAPSFTVDSATQITAISPPSTAIGLRAITVTTPGGTSAYVDAGGFTYTAPAPSVTTISPSSGPLSGGTNVVITGNNFTGATRVTFGVAGHAPSFTVDSPTQITAVSPPSTTIALRAITVTTVGGTSAYADAGVFAYVAKPAVTAISPSSGPQSGGTTVVIAGTGFTGATEVVFGDAGPASSFTVDNAYRITATSPSSDTAGLQPISVVTPGGASAETDAGSFTYVARPAVTGVSPASGPTTGGTSVVITGTDFTGATEVVFGAAGPASSFTVDSPTRITATSPSTATIGARHVSVTTTGGASAEVDADLFTYTPVITRVTPSAGPMSGGTEVVITGTGFTDATEVTFGDAGPAAAFTVDSATRITATSPAASDTGARNIRVTTADGVITGVEPAADRFTYTEQPDACGDLLLKEDGSTWTCSFVDDFDGDSLDPTKWATQDTSLTGFRSGQTCYRNTPENVDVHNGELRLTARREAEEIACHNVLLGAFSTPYTGGTIGTRGKFSQTYGRFEVRAKYPETTVPGLHGGFWAMPVDSVYGAWPASGEIDIAEWWSNAPNHVLPTLHYLGDTIDDTGVGCQVSTPSSYHTYTMEWSPEEIRFFIDGDLCFERPLSVTGLLGGKPFDQPFSMILTMGVDLPWGPNAVTEATELPATYTVDYAKVWR